MAYGTLRVMVDDEPTFAALVKCRASLKCRGPHTALKISVGVRFGESML